MATPVFDIEKSVFFVMDEVGGGSDAGGCTQDWWDTEVAASDEATAMAKLMDVSTGAPIIEMDAVDYVGGTNTLTKANIHVGVEVGMVANVYYDSGVGTVVADRYKITNVDTDELICSGINGTDCAVHVIVGGAFDNLQDALDRIYAVDHSVTIYIQSTPVLGVTIDADFYGGSNTNNTFKRIIGFNTVPGDMDFGGEYYESPFEILQAGSIDSNKTVVIDGDGGGFDILNVAVDNIIFENLHLTNAPGEEAILFTGTPENIVFRNCRFSDVDFVYNTAAHSVLVDSCYSHSDLTGNHYQMTGNSQTILNCVGNVAATKIFAVVAIAVYGCCVIGCIAVNGARGVRVFGHGITVSNNTFYNQTSYGIDITGGVHIIAYNNIFDLYPGAVGLYADTSGSYICNDYNCFIESDGTPLTVGSHGSGGEIPVIGPHSIEVDPLFVDVDANDFRLKSSSPVRRIGKPTIGAT